MTIAEPAEAVRMAYNRPNVDEYPRLAQTIINLDSTRLILGRLIVSFLMILATTSCTRADHFVW
jgi:hypothetical protein